MESMQELPPDCMNVSFLNGNVKVQVPTFISDEHYYSTLANLRNLSVAASKGMNFFIDLSQQKSLSPPFVEKLFHLKADLDKKGCTMKLTGISQMSNSAPEPTFDGAKDESGPTP